MRDMGWLDGCGSSRPRWPVVTCVGWSRRVRSSSRCSPCDEYDDEHLPGAVPLPLKALTRDTAKQVLARGRPVIVSC